MTKEQLIEVENIINAWVNAGLTQKTDIMDIDEAKKQEQWRCLMKNMIQK
ncbi:MAG: hypothetical protein L6V95_14110 [Candidatus Melainabacteria bacterium]|nr:MAG: hypothetical protein L6V95_14110 [Candidatus Melainabacteria bacterium]